MTKPTWKFIGGGLIVLLLAIQLVPTTAPGNPPVETEVAVPDDVMRVLRQSCYDCHSHETSWPWYSSVAPAKWLVRHDVTEARRGLNFSAWNRYDADRQTLVDYARTRAEAEGASGGDEGGGEGREAAGDGVGGATDTDRGSASRN